MNISEKIHMKKSPTIIKFKKTILKKKISKQSSQSSPVTVIQRKVQEQINPSNRAPLQTV